MNLTIEEEEENKNYDEISSNYNIKLPTTIIKYNYFIELNPFLIKDNSCLNINDEKSFAAEELIYFHTLEQSNEIGNIRDKGNVFNDKNNYLEGKSHKEIIQLKIKENIYLKKPFNEKKNLGRKKKSYEGLGEHNKFSDDNIIRKCKHVILDSVFVFINEKIKLFYSDMSKRALKERTLFKLKQNQSRSSMVNYNKMFLNKTLKSIFSENISTKYSRYSPSHNKEIIELLINEKDENKRNTFNIIFNLTFFDCLKHFRGSEIVEELNGLNQLEDYLNGIKIFNNYDEYCNLFKFFINNFEKIIMEKKGRIRRKK